MARLQPENFARAKPRKKCCTQKNELEEVRGPTKAIETMDNGPIFTDLRLK